MNFIKKVHYTPELLLLATTHLIQSIGVVSAIITIMAATEDRPSISLKCLVSICALLCLIYTTWRMWPTKCLNIYLAPRKMVKLITGDLFEQKGIIVIPVNNYFDMTTERDVIGKKSIHGQFIKMYSEKHPEDNINEQIEDTLLKDGINRQSQNVSRKFPKNNDRYPLGTVARIFDKDQTYYLTVVSEFDDNNHVIPQPEKFGFILQMMLKNITIYCSGNDVYMPVIGTGLMDMPMRLDEMIEFILDNIKFCGGYNSSVGCIHIVIREKDIENVSFRIIQSHKSSIFNKFYK